MDIRVKIFMLHMFTGVVIIVIAQEFYKVIFNNHSLIGAIVNSLIACLGFSLTRLVLNHDIKKFERRKKQAKEYKLEEKGIVSDLSLSSTR